jgi:hypothetical protein
MVILPISILQLVALCLPIQGIGGLINGSTAIPAKILVPSEDPERYYEGTTPDYKSEGYLNARLMLITNKHSPRMTATMKVGLNVLR